MDSYMCYTHTIHQEAQDRLHHRSTRTPAPRLSHHAPADHPPQRRRLRLALSDLLSTVRSRVFGARSSTAPSIHADIATPPSAEPAAIE